ncbi:serine hydrolase [Vibrio vulnificus]|uniref:serine hydrolase domain-containing protein n=1 Tax=Vibrio vulnificus TaxID=672 RepID=UPI0005F21ED4|nr:serine hydrolase [Vibrio vulnificus]AUJ36705.1 6-aminohexanoate hydrolase [Vibrio vulnificus]EGR0057403.1 beta-lactamase family protein [Vibrio vulnificus]EGR0080967.1 beta-lactamase family protein [Vibrio vulnificus]EGR7951184.1 beta-lactamase family protein [Vibrio vulnificus]EJY4609204.1 serine hydrolase [Vibrio vulnificus]
MKKLVALSIAAAITSGAAMANVIVNETTTNKAVAETHDFFLEKGNRVKLQFPIAESHFAWQNISRFYNTAQIERDGAVYQFPYSIDDNIGNIKATVQGKELTLNQHLDNYPVDAFLVVKNGEIVFERYNTMRKTDKHNWFSNSKITTGIELAKLVEEGKVKEQDPVSKYIPELKGSAWDTVKVIDVANMATGLNATEHDEPNPDSRTNPDQPFFKWLVSIGVFDGDSTQKPLDVLSEMTRRQEAGKTFEYNSINTFVLARIIENVRGLPMNEIISRDLWQKMGANNDAYTVVSPVGGYPLMFFSMNSTIEDMAKFGMLLTPSGAKLGDGAVSKEVVQRIQASGKQEAFEGGYVGKVMANSFYNDSNLKNGYMFDTIFEDGDLYKGGVGGQGIYISPDKDLVVTFFSTSTGKNQEETYAREIAKYFANN